MSTYDAKRAEQFIRNATVKVFADGVFSGTGFFFTENGYLLTAYHCVRDASKLSIQTPYDGKFLAVLQPDKSLSDDQYDLAVMKVDYHPSDYLPLAQAAETHG